MSNLGLNSLINLFSRIWTTVSNFIFVPFYIDLLGVEAYGLITFFTTLQTTLNLLGLGLSKTLRREFAMASSVVDNQYKYSILRSIEFIYFCIALIITALCSGCSGYIAEFFLSANKLPIEVVDLTIKLMGVSIAAQLLANLYLGCLFGQEQQGLANLIQFCWSVIKNVGVILVISLVYADIILFYSWHIVIDMLYMFFLRLIIVTSLARNTSTRLWWNIREIKKIWRVLNYSFGIMLISIGYAINSQVDKIIISGSFSLTYVGAYNSAYNLGFVASIFSASIGVAIFPRFSNLFSKGAIEEEKCLFLKVNKVSNILTASVGAYIAIFSYELLLVWTRNVEIATIMRLAAAPLILGTTINSLEEVPYNFLLANGITKANTIQTCFSIVYCIVITPLFISFWGLFGAAVSWLIQLATMSIVYLIYFYWSTFPKTWARNILSSTILPLLFSVFMAFLVRSFISRYVQSIYCVVAFAILGGCLNVGILLLIFMRKDLYDFIRRLG